MKLNRVIIISVILSTISIIGGNKLFAQNILLDTILSKEEIIWLQENKNEIKYAPNPFWPPADYIENNTIHKGIVADYIKIFKQNLNISFQNVYFKNWIDIHQGLKLSEVDFVGAIQKTDEREKYLIFTDEFLKIPLAILVKKDYLKSFSEDNITHMKLACVKGYSSLDYVNEKYPGITIIECEDDLSALLKTSLGETDGTIIDLMSASYIVEKYGINNLSLGKELDFVWELRFGVRKDLPELCSILNKVLKTIDADKRQQIFNKWVNIQGFQPKNFVEIHSEKIIFILIVLFSLLIISFLFSIFLKKQVKKQTFHLETAKEKAEESEQQLKLISNNFVNGMIYQVAIIDENRRRFNYVSDSVIKLYGCTAEEAMGNPDLIYGKIHPDDLSLLITEEKKALKNMSVFNVEARAINPDGSIRWSYYISQPRIINNLVCWDGIEVDISERKKMEIDLKISKEKAEESDRLKSAFLANMSHEIRTPMNGILGFSDLLKTPNLSNKKQEQYIDIIKKSGDRMLNIINDIISISKIESGQMEVNMRESDIIEQIEYIYSFFKPEIEGKGIPFSFKTSLPSGGVIIKTDREKLYAILTNLIKNAIKYTSKGSIEVGCINKDTSLEFYVKDTGIGIPEDRKDAIFERFVQADIADIRAYQGAGLGLSISKAYVEMLGGKIWVESKPGKGSVFYFTHPY